MPISRILPIGLLALALSQVGSPASSASPAGFNHRHVILIVWDGMRPDFLTAGNAPTLYQLARNGVTFAHHRSVYLSATEVNGTALFTGSYPADDGIMGNAEYRPEIDALKPVHTEVPEVVRRGDDLANHHYLRRFTLPEIVRKAGGRTAVAGAKPVTLLADRAAGTSE